MPNKNLSKKILIGALLGLGVGVFVFLTVNYLYGYHSNPVLNFVVIVSTLLFYITAPILGFFSHSSQSVQSVILVVVWIILGGLIGLIAGVITKRKR